jgi:predicted MFS family arabinose efflux permease
MRPERANAAYAAIFRSAILLGPPLAGLLIAALGTSVVFWIDAATFAVSALLVGLAAPAADTNTVETGARSYLADLRAGLAFLRREKVLQALMVVPTVFDTLLNPLVAVLLPVYLSRTYGSATTFGFVLGALGGGQLLGTLAYGAAAPRLSRHRTLMFAYSGVAAATLAIAALPPLPLLIGAVFISGVVMGPVGPLMQTVFQERTPRELLARVLGASAAVRLAALPLGMVGAGYAIEGVGIQACALVIAGGCGAAALWGLASRSLNEVDSDRADIQRHDDAKTREREA